MNMQNDEVWKLLYPRVSKSLCKGYCNGLFNQGKDQFFAATYVTDFPTDDDLAFLLSRFDAGYTIITSPSSNSGPVRWELVPPGTGTQPNQCKAYSVSFNGAYFEGEWFIIKSLTFFGTADEELARNSVFPAEVFSNPIYKPYKQFSPKYINVEMLEFSGAPELVAIVKQSRKEKTNWAFRNYLEIAILWSLAEKLRIYYPAKYDSTVGMYGTEHFSSIFPVHKRHVLLVTGALGLSETGYSVRYLVYVPEGGIIYEWNYFAADRTAFNYGESVVDQLKTVTTWNNTSYLQSSCTLDDNHFWEQYVFKKENEGYKYLHELTFNEDRDSFKL